MYTTIQSKENAIRRYTYTALFNAHSTLDDVDEALVLYARIFTNFAQIPASTCFDDIYSASAHQQIVAYSESHYVEMKIF